VTVSIVEFGAGNGHHAHYLSLIAEAWRSQRGGELLTISVRQSLLERHPDLVQEPNADAVVKILPLPEQADRAVEEAMWNSGVSMASTLPGGQIDSSVAALWQVAQDEASRSKARHLFLAEIDRCLPALAGGLTSSFPVSGIWFKPRFHYRDLKWQGTPRGAFDTAEKWMLARALANPDLRQLLVLDPFAAEKLARSSQGGEKVRWLADPVASFPLADRDAARRDFGVGDKRVVLHFGEIGSRKGIVQLLQACGMLNRAAAARLALLMAGPVSDLDQGKISGWIEAARSAGCAVTYIPEYVSDSVAGRLFAAADLVSVAYSGHAGMSGVLLSAAAHGRPVVAQAEGLIGALTARHSLGTVLSAGDPTSVAAFLSNFVHLASVEGFDRITADAFAKRHGRARFQRELIRTLSLAP
jgi:glycosyltransferase involved in cell wall biosynthesis